jgi:hypothetical protein
VLTDHADEQPIQELLQRNAASSRHLCAPNAQVLVAPLTWGEDDEDVLKRGIGTYNWVIGSDVTYSPAAHEALAATLASLLAPPPTSDAAADAATATNTSAADSAAMPPVTRATRAVLSHEHRSSARRTLWGTLSRQWRWDAADPTLASFRAAATRHGLGLSLLRADLPVDEVKGGFRRWTADISIFEVVRM